MSAAEFSPEPEFYISPAFGLDPSDYYSPTAPNRGLLSNETRITDLNEFTAIMDWLDDHPEELFRLEVEQQRTIPDPAVAARYIIDRDNRARLAEAWDERSETPDNYELLCAAAYFNVPLPATWRDVRIGMEWYDRSMLALMHALNGRQTIIETFDE